MSVRMSANAVLRALAAGLLSVAAGASLAASGAAAQGWGDDGWAEPPIRYRAEPNRDLEVYPDDYSDEDIEDAQRSRGFVRRTPPGLRRWDDRNFGDENDESTDDRDGVDADDRAPPRNAMPDDDTGDDDGGARNGRAGLEPAKPPAPTAGEFAPGGRPAVRAEAPPVVAFSSAYPAGSIVIDSSARRLYYVRGHMSAFAYPIGVGREGFAWFGSEKVSRISDWPDWYPPAEMRKRQPKLPERMLGGVNNPLGAKAIYLGNTLYRIHGTNDPSSIGRAQSSGCFRMMNKHVVHLASLVKVGTPVTVVRSLGRGVNVVSAPGRRTEPRITARNERFERVTRPPPPVRWRDDRYDADDYYDYGGRYR